MTVSRRTVLAALATGLAGGAGSHALASAKPAPVAGTDPGGIAIAVLGSGIDYRHPGLAQRLARDGEGDLIGWDFVTNDNRPYEVPPGGGLVVPGVPGAGLTGAGTAAGLLLANLAPAARLVAVRENPSDPAALGRMMSFVSQTAATLVVWPSADAKRPDLAILPLAADRFADRESRPDLSGFRTISVSFPNERDHIGCWHGACSSSPSPPPRAATARECVREKAKRSRHQDDPFRPTRSDGPDKHAGSSGSPPRRAACRDGTLGSGLRE